MCLFTASFADAQTRGEKFESAYKQAVEANDYPAIIAIIKPLAEQGEKLMQADLAFRYIKGEGVPQSDTQGAQWARKSAVQGYDEAQHLMGLLYAHNKGTAQFKNQYPNETAIMWIEKAAAQKNKQAIQILKIWVFASKFSRA